MIKQISIFLENSKGQLSDIAGILAQSGINLAAMNIAETNDYGIIRIISENISDAAKKLKEAGYIASVSDVSEAYVPDRPGGMYKLLKELSDNEIGIEYMYSALSPKEKTARLILKTDDPEKAEKIIEGLKTADD